MKAYKFRIYPTKLQDIEMRRQLWLAKELWNELLAHTKRMYREYGKFATRRTLQMMVKDTGLYSQTQQAIAHRIDDAVRRFLKLKKQGKKVGFPRFKNFDRMKSLHYPQNGFALGEKLSVTPFGEVAIVKHREVEGRIKTLTLKRESSGKWFAIFTAEEPAKEPRVNIGEKVGLDVGLKCFAQLSDGEKIANPRHFGEYEDQLAKAQRQLSKKKKGSNNRRKTKIKVAKIHEKIRNVRRDFLHKTSTTLVNKYSLIAMEKLEVQDMAKKENRLGKSINDVGWSELANMLSYKAGNAGSRVVFVNPKNTTKTCHRCGSVQDMPLSERTYCCLSCGMVENRDLNAARNILARATLGQSGSNASGDGIVMPSLSEEAHALGVGACHKALLQT